MTTIKDLIESIGLVQALTTIIPTCLIILIGIKRMFNKSSKMNKYMILTKRETKTTLGTDTFELTNDMQIRLLIDEKEKLQKDLDDEKNKNALLNRQYNSLSLKFLFLGLIILLQFILNKISHKDRKKELK